MHETLATKLKDNIDNVSPIIWGSSELFSLQK
jgi:hypothetical protein